ncbi:hypothetical protein PACTADRAFT_20287, partial [Pachysolen tannophilus NRRL Y-2460]
LFTASTTSLSHISNVLNSITPLGSKCLVTINENGLFFTVNDNNICKVQLNLDSKFFDSFNYNPIKTSSISDSKNIKFGLDLFLFVESVSLVNNYNSNLSNSNNHNNGIGGVTVKTICTLSYEGYGNPFILSFEDDKMLERVEFQTYDDLDEDEDFPHYFEIDNDKLILEIILKSPILYDILKDLKEIQTEEILIYGDTKNGKKNLIFISKGELGYSKLVFPSNRSILEQLVIYKAIALKNVSYDDEVYNFPDEENIEYIPTNTDSLTSFYKFNYFNKLTRAVKLSSKLKIKKDAKGLTSINLLIKDEKNLSNSVIEFQILE